MAAARLVSVVALCSSGVLGLVMQSWLQLGMVVGELRRVWWWLVGGRFGCSYCAPSGEILIPTWLELAMVTPAGVTYFIGSIVVRCVHSCACGLDSGGKPQIWDRAMEALLYVFLVGGIVSESPAVRDWGKMVVVGL
jgi:hypothetical protein